MEKSNRTIKAIYAYMDIVNNWLDDTDGKLNEVETKVGELHRVTASPVSIEGHSVDGSPVKEPGDETKDDGDEGKTREEPEDTEGREGLSEDEKEDLRITIQRIKDDLKANSNVKHLNQARIERVRLLVDDIRDDVDEDGSNSIKERISEIGVRYEKIDSRLDHIIQEEKPQELALSGPELVTVETSTNLQSAPPEQTTTEGTSEDTAGDVRKEGTSVEPYSGKVTLDVTEWKAVAINLRDFLNRMQMNIRDIDSKNYVEMRECEVDTKVGIFDVLYSNLCFNFIVKSGRLNKLLDKLLSVYNV